MEHPDPTPQAAEGPQDAPESLPAPAASPAAAAAAPARVTARVEDQEHELLPAATQVTARPQLPAVLPKDWDLSDLTVECAPGRVPELLTDTQSRARILLRAGAGADAAAD